MVHLGIETNTINDLSEYSETKKDGRSLRLKQLLSTLSATRDHTLWWLDCTFTGTQHTRPGKSKYVRVQRNRIEPQLCACDRREKKIEDA